MKYPTYLPTDFVKQDDKARFKSYLDGFKPLGSDYEPTKAAPDLFTEAARIAREKGYDDDAGRVVQAILRTEGALSGEVGDKDLPGGGSFGPLQFYRKYGMLPSYAKSLGVSEDDAAEHARKNPTHAIDWALGDYLGNAIREGQAKGLRGAELATYAQQHGQRSQAPERAGQNYSAMFGGGTPIPAHAPTTVGPREAAIPAHTPVDDKAEFGKYLSSFPELGSDLQMGKERAIPAHEPKDDKQAFGEFLKSFPPLGGDLLGEAAKQLPFVGPAVQNLGKAAEPLGAAMNWYGKNVQGPQMEAIHRAGLESGASESLGEPFAVQRGMAAQPLATLLPTAVRDISESGGLPEWWRNLTETYEQRPEDFPGQKGVAELAVPSEIVANVITEPAAIGRAAKGVAGAAGKALPEAGRLGRALAGEAGEQLLERTPMRTFAGDLGESAEQLSKQAGTKGALPEDVRYNPKLASEARALPDGTIEVGPKYWNLPNDEARRLVVAHERAHGMGLEEAAFKDDEFWRLMQQEEMFGPIDPETGQIMRGINGAFKPGENVTEAYVLLNEQPQWLKEHYPKAYKYVAELAQREGIPVSQVVADDVKAMTPPAPIKEPLTKPPAIKGKGEKVEQPPRKQAWEMSLTDFLATHPRKEQVPTEELISVWHSQVQRAMRQGKNVSPAIAQLQEELARQVTIRPEAKAWELPWEEWAKQRQIPMSTPLERDVAHKAHHDIVSHAMDKGETVWRGAVEAHPDLIAKYGVTKPAAAAPTPKQQGPQRVYDEQLDQAIQFQRQKYDSLHATDPDVPSADDAPIVQTLEGIREARQLAQRTGDMPEVQRALLDNSKRIEQLPEVQAALSEGTVPSTKAKGQKIEQKKSQPKARDAVETVAEEGAEQGVQQVQGDEGGVPRVPPRAGGPPTASNAANRTLLEMYTKGPSGEGGQGAWDRLELARRAFVRATTDRDVDLAQFQKAAQKAKGTPLSADEMAYELNRLNPDKSAEVAIQDSLKPAIQAAGDDRAWLSVYLTHLDNIDVARAMGQKVERELGAAAGAKAARERKFSGGLDVAASRQALADMTQELGPERMQKIEVAARQVQEFVKGRRDRLAEAGVISTELRDALAEMYPNYVPTRILDYMQEPVNIARGKSLSLSDTGLRRNTIEGTVREREDPLASLVRLSYQSEATARKNEAFNAFVKLREMMPDVQDKIREVADNYVVRRNEAKVTGFVEGKRVTYAMPKELEAVIKAEPGAVIPGLVGDVWGALMHGFRAAATSRFPLFLATNALLDAATYATRASIREGGPQHLPRVLIELGRSYGDAFSGLFTREYHGTTAEFLRRGGGQFGFFQGTPGATRRTVQDLSRKHIFEIQSAKDIARLTRDLVTFKPVEAIGERIELAPRVAMYNLASRRTNTVKAVIEGRTVTIDFSQGGNISKLLNQFIPFFNVGMQALVQPVRAFAENPRAFVASVGTLIVGPTIAAEAWNRADPQRAKDYDDVPDYIKDQGVVIMLPIEAPIDSRGNRRPQFFLIRMREFAPFAIAAREAANRAMGGEAREWQDLIGSGVMSVSPVQGNSLGDVVAGFSPLGVSTGGQLAANYDYFRGRMIATKGGDERASEVSKVLANALGVRPSQVEFAIRDLTAGLGGTALAAGQLVAGKTEATGAIQDMSVVGGLAGRFVKSGIGGNLDRAQARLISPQGKQILKDNSIDLSIGPVGNTIEGVPLNVEEQTMYQELTNQYLDEALREIVKLPKWAEYDMDVRADIARGAVDGARDGAGAEVFKKMGNEEIRRRLKALKEAS